MPSNLFPLWYGKQTPFGNASTSFQVIEFGFEAREIRIDNRGAQALYVSLGRAQETTSTGVSAAVSTADYQIVSSGVMELHSVFPLSGFAGYTTSTTAGGVLANILAIG